MACGREGFKLMLVIGMRGMWEVDVGVVGRDGSLGVGGLGGLFWVRISW